jgi:hypothetical protein
MSERRVRSVVVPAEREASVAEFERLLGRMVMSRTQAEGAPIRRERILLGESRARDSVDAAWRSLAGQQGARTDVTFVIFRDDRGRVERVLVELRGERAPTPPPPHAPPRPRFLTFNPEILRRRRRELQEQIESADRRAYDAQQVAAQHGSRLFTLDPDESSDARAIQQVANGLEILGGGPDPTGHGAEVAIELRIRREMEEIAARREREAEALRATLRSVERDLADRERDMTRFRSGERVPGPIGRDG